MHGAEEGEWEKKTLRRWNLEFDVEPPSSVRLNTHTHTHTHTRAKGTEDSGKVTGPHV